jgi:enoyl-CoA hydratase
LTIESKFVKTKREEAALVVTLDNPPVNALNSEMLDALEKVSASASSDSSVLGVVITGSGSNAFCAGADLKILQTLQPEDAVRMVSLGHKTFGAIENCTKPVVAAINGLCLGGGNELAMSCDLRFASDRARFGQPEVTLGLIPAWGGTQRLSRLVGRAKAKELIFSGQMISSQEALRIGLVNKVVPDGEELRAATDYVRMLSAKVSPVAVQQAKRAINSGLDEPSIEKGLEHEIDAIKIVAQSSDLREGIEAYLSKRPPKFSGQ